VIISAPRKRNRADPLQERGDGKEKEKNRQNDRGGEDRGEKKKEDAGKGRKSKPPSISQRS